MNVKLHIEKLILDGLNITNDQKGPIGAAVQQELARLIEAEGLASGLQSNLAVPDIRTAAVQIEPSVSPRQIGKQIARAIYAGIGPQPSASTGRR